LLLTDSRRATEQLPMTDDNNTTAGLDQADEDILSYAVSDEALEAAAGTERGVNAAFLLETISGIFGCCH
jgi:hypothetical protein